MGSKDREALLPIFRYTQGGQLLFELRDGQSRVMHVRADNPISDDDLLLGTSATSDTQVREEPFAVSDVIRVRTWPTGGLLYYRADSGELRFVEGFFSINLRIDLAFQPRWSCRIGAREAGYLIGVFSGSASDEPTFWDDWPRKYPLPEHEFVGLVQAAEALHVPAKPNYAMGRDGSAYELVLGNGHNQSHFRWWNEPPSEWRELEQYTMKILQVVRLNCPGEAGPLIAE